MTKRIILLVLALLPLTIQAQQRTPQSRQERATAPYVAQDFTYLIGMKGFTPLQLKRHFKLYEGYVKTTNQFLEILSQLEADGKQGTPCWNEIKRRLSWDWDGMRLHEYYFGNMGGKPPAKPNEQSGIYKRITAQYGSYEKWEADFIATGMLRGIGWVVLFQDPRSGRLLNIWIGEHNIGELAGATPLLIMDVWEHAYAWDYGLDRRAYINAFFENIDWAVVTQRYLAEPVRKPHAASPKQK